MRCSLHRSFSTRGWRWHNQGIDSSGIHDTTVPRGRFAALSNMYSDSEHGLIVRACSTPDAGGRVVVLAGSTGRRKKLRVVGHSRRTVR